MRGVGSDFVPTMALADKAQTHAPSVLKAILGSGQYWPETILTEDVVTVTARDQAIVHVMQPEIASAILADDGTLFRKHAIYRKIAGGESGPKSMIAAEGRAGWAAKSAYGPVFNPRNATGYVPMIQAVVRRRTKDLVASASPANLSAVLATITFEIIWRVMFDPDETGAPLPDFVETAIAEIFRARMNSDHRRVAGLIKQVADFSIAFRHACPHQRPSAFDEGGQAGLGADVLRDNIRLFLSAGHKTSAAAVSWALWLLTRAPDAMTAVLEETAQCDVQSKTAFQHMPVTLAVLNEAMRLFPPAIMTVRQTQQDMQLGGIPLAAGTPVVVNFYAMHRHRKLWSDPDAFRPQRFLPSQTAAIPPGAFRPFSAGPHVCLGQKFAELESIVILTEVLRAVRFTAGTDTPRPVYSFTLHAWNGISLSAHALAPS